MDTLDVGLLGVRLSTGFVFLYAAWKNTRNRDAWSWTVGEAALLFQEVSPAVRDRIVKSAAAAGMVMMYGGGLSLLLGVAPRIGGVAIILFSLLGMRIHAIRAAEGRAAGLEGNAMGWSAFSGHVPAGLKNWALVGVGLLIVLNGAGAYALGPDIGRGCF